MHKGREELRRGVRSLVEVASREMEALDADPATGEAAPDESPAQQPERPILKLVRESGGTAGSVPTVDVPAGTGAGATGASLPAPVPVSPGLPARPGDVRPRPSPLQGVPTEPSDVHPKRGVCGAYYVSHACWEVEEAYCNRALHICMLRDCPVYHLNRAEMEPRFAKKFAHLW